MTLTPIATAPKAKIADAEARLRHVFIHNMEFERSIGVHAHEKGKTQRVRLNLDLGVTEDDAPLKDELGAVVCYETIAERVRRMAAQGHINLVETFAEMIAAACLTDRRVRSVRVRVEKLDALDDAESVGVEIERRQTAP